MQNNYNERVLGLQVKQLTLNIQQLAVMLKKLNERVEVLEKSKGVAQPLTNQLKDKNQEIKEDDTNQDSDIKVVITEE